MIHVVALILLAAAGPAPGTAVQAKPSSPYVVAQPTPPLPAAAQKIIDAFRAREREILARAEKQLEPERRAAAKQLQALQDQLTRAARLDDALAVRAAIREVSGVLPDPGNLSLSVEQIGHTLRYQVTGSTTGSIWGTDTYTSDSNLATVAVHAGLLQAGQSGVIVVHVVRGMQSYRGSTRNGVTSYPYGPWYVSFEVSRTE